MCDNEMKKDQEATMKILIAAAHESERARIRTIILQMLGKVDTTTTEGKIYSDALRSVLNRLGD